LRHGRGKVVAQLRRNGQKLLRHNAANGVNPKVFRRRMAASIAEKPGFGVISAGFKRLSKNIFLGGKMLI
jgi:hypothetical protein